MDDTELDFQTQISVDDGAMSLADLAGIDMDQVQEVRFETLPLGNYTFKASAGEMKIVDVEDESTGTKKKVVVLEVPHEIIAVNVLVDKTLDPATFIGRKHKESFFIKTTDGLGRYKAYLTDSNFQGKGSLQETLAQLDGHAFDANIGHTAKKGDPDVKYANLRFAKKKK